MLPLLRVHFRGRHRLYCVNAVQVDMLTAAFSPFGIVQNVKLVRDKGGIVAAAILARLPSTHMQQWQVSITLRPLFNACLQSAVAYVKFDKASSAARALEVMHEAVLNEGRGPLLKVFLAEAPSSRCSS